MNRVFNIGTSEFEYPVSAEYEMYSITENRSIAKGFLIQSKKLVLKEVEGVITEVYKVNNIVGDTVYPAVSYTLDLKTPLDFYRFVYCGLQKNNGIINNFVRFGKPANHPMAFGRMKGLSKVVRIVPEMPIEVYKMFPHNIKKIYWWSQKPYGLVVEWLTKRYEPLYSKDYLAGLES